LHKQRHEMAADEAGPAKDGDAAGCHTCPRLRQPERVSSSLSMHIYPAWQAPQRIA
jgi:hypothetical protein